MEIKMKIILKFYVSLSAMVFTSIVSKSLLMMSLLLLKRKYTQKYNLCSLVSQ